MSRFLTGLLAGTALLTGIGSANALTISGGTASVSSKLTDYTSFALGSLNKFDTTLGTLTQVTITVIYGFNSTITVSATTPSSGDTRTESGAQFSASDSGVTSVLNSLVNTTSVSFGLTTLNPAAYDLLGTKRPYSLSSGSTTYASNVPDTTLIFTDTIPADLSAFGVSGGGVFTALASTLTGLTGSTTGGNATITQSTLADQSISLSYDYVLTPPSTVPEPASMALLGAGLLGAGLLRRRVK